MKTASLLVAPLALVELFVPPPRLSFVAPSILLLLAVAVVVLVVV